MARLGVTYEQVEAAAEKIAAANSMPTVERVRRELNNTGSNSTISNHLREWKAQRLNKPPTLNYHKVNLADPVQNAIYKAVEEVKLKAQEEIARIQQEADEAIETAKQGRAEAVQELQQLKEKLKNTELSLNHSQANESIAQKKLAEARQQQAITEARANESEKNWQIHKEVTDQHLQALIASQEENFRHLNAHLAHVEQKYKEDIQEYRTLMEEQRGTFIAKIDNLETLCNSQKEALIKKDAEIGVLQLLNKELNEQKRRLEIHLSMGNPDQIQQGNMQKDTQIKELQEQVEQLQQQLERV